MTKVKAQREKQEMRSHSLKAISVGVKEINLKYDLAKIIQFHELSNLLFIFKVEK